MVFPSFSTLSMILETAKKEKKKGTDALVIIC